MRIRPATHAEIRKAIRSVVRENQDQEPCFALKMRLLGGLIPDLNVERYIGKGFLVRAIEREVMRTPSLAARVRDQAPHVPEEVVEDIARGVLVWADGFESYEEVVLGLYYDAIDRLKECVAERQEGVDEWVLEMVYGRKLRRLIVRDLRQVAHLANA